MLRNLFLGSDGAAFDPTRLACEHVVRDPRCDGQDPEPVATTSCKIDLVMLFSGMGGSQENKFTPKDNQ